MTKNREKQVQIPETLFKDMTNIIHHIVLNEDLCKYFDVSTIEHLEKQLEDKWKKIYEHDLYSKSKDRTLTSEKREEAKKEYFDSKGVSEDFRY